MAQLFTRIHHFYGCVIDSPSYLRLCPFYCVCLLMTRRFWYIIVIDMSLIVICIPLMFWRHIADACNHLFEIYDKFSVVDCKCILFIAISLLSLSMFHGSLLLVSLPWCLRPFHFIGVYCCFIDVNWCVVVVLRYAILVRCHVIDSCRYCIDFIVISLRCCYFLCYYCYFTG